MNVFKLLKKLRRLRKDAKKKKLLEWIIQKRNNDGVFVMRLFECFFTLPWWLAWSWFYFLCYFIFEFK